MRFVGLDSLDPDEGALERPPFCGLHALQRRHHRLVLHGGRVGSRVRGPLAEAEQRARKGAVRRGAVRRGPR